MRSGKSSRFCSFLLLFLAFAAPAAAQKKQKAPSDAGIADQVRVAVLRLPYYGVFDLISFDVGNGAVTLGGDVYRGFLKNDAEDAVREIPGVTRVIDKIEVLPVSPDDDRLRRALFRRIYTDQFLARYGTPLHGLGRSAIARRYWGRRWPRMGRWARAPFLNMEPIGSYAIHIIVDRGEVSLFGSVDNEVDKTKAGLDARGVFGVRTVDNDIQVDRE